MSVFDPAITTYTAQDGKGVFFVSMDKPDTPVAPKAPEPKANPRYLVSATESDDPPQFGELSIFIWKNLVEKIKPIAGKFWIAGGAIRDFFAGQKPRDFDLFCRSAEDLAAVQWGLEGIANTKLIDNDKLVRFKLGDLEIDLVKRYYAGPQDCIDHFDFTVCAAALEFTMGQEPEFSRLHYHVNFFRDLATRRLMLLSLPEPLDTVRRVIKYTKKGFTICNNELTTLLAAVQTTPALTNDVFYKWD
jgi:hypothetical protein